MPSDDNVTRLARYRVGQLIQHRMFGYRGVIFDVDPVFRGSEDWYEHMAKSQPPKDRPWYHVLVHDAQHTTYVAERNLEPDDSEAPVRHPALDEVFSVFKDGRYITKEKIN